MKIKSWFPVKEHRTDERIQRAIERHGGQELWNSLRSIVVRVQALGGPLPLVKGIGRTFPRPGVAEIFPGRRRVEFRDYGQQGRTGVFDRGAVGIAGPGLDDQALKGNYRATFAGLGKNRRWTPLDGLYFFGYALVTYFSVPFILPELSPAVLPWKNGFKVKARFPADFDTHCAVQTFYFNREGLLQRHDYTVDVVGAWARGSHFTSNYHEVQNFMVASNRQVYARLGRLVTPIPVLKARVEGQSISRNRQAARVSN